MIDKFNIFASSRHICNIQGPISSSMLLQTTVYNEHTANGNNYLKIDMEQQVHYQLMFNASGM